MRMPRRHDGVAAIEIEIPLAGAGVDPDIFAALDDERELLVGCDLIVLFNVNDVFHLRLRAHLARSFSGDHKGSPLQVNYGLLPASIKPVRSSMPNIRFMFCTAWPAAPLTRLSIATKTITVSSCAA